MSGRYVERGSFISYVTAHQLVPRTAEFRRCQPVLFPRLQGRAPGARALPAHLRCDGLCVEHAWQL
jgi:hypothetical protein